MIFKKKEELKVAEQSKKKAWVATKKEKEKAKYEPFHREITRSVKCDGGPMDLIWVFTEYKKPDFVAPQFRLQEQKFVQDGRERRPMPACPVAWEVDMEVRIEAYMAYQVHVAAAKDNR